MDEGKLRLQKIKVELACAMRLMFRRGVSAPWNAGHGSVKVDGDRLIVNRFGSSFATMSPDDMLLIDLDGKILDGIGSVNQTIALHCHIHLLNPDTKVALHTHSDAVVTLGAFLQVPKIYDQDSCLLAGGIGYVAKKHQALDTSPEVAEKFRDEPELSVVIAPNHGAFAQGQSLAQATYFMIQVEHMCQRHLDIAKAAAALGREPREIPFEDAQAIRRDQIGTIPWERGWEEQMRRLSMTDPDLVLMREKLKNPGW